MNRKKVKSLKDLYEFYRRYYNATGIKEYPDLLFTLLLLSSRTISYPKNSFLDAEGLYKMNSNHNILDGYILRIESEFNFTDANYRKYIKAKTGKELKKITMEDKFKYCYKPAVDLFLNRNNVVTNTILTPEAMFMNDCKKNIFESNVFDHLEFNFNEDYRTVIDRVDFNKKDFFSRQVRLQKNNQKKMVKSNEQ